jgi:hypothetical protein
MLSQGVLMLMTGLVFWEIKYQVFEEVRLRLEAGLLI